MPYDWSTQKNVHDAIHKTVNSLEKKPTRGWTMDGTKERTKQNQKQACIRLRLSISYLREIKRNTKEPNHSKLVCP